MLTGSAVARNHRLEEHGSKPPDHIVDLLRRKLCQVGVHRGAPIEHSVDEASGHAGDQQVPVRQPAEASGFLSADEPVHDRDAAIVDPVHGIATDVGQPQMSVSQRGHSGMRSAALAETTSQLDRRTDPTAASS